MPTGAAEERVLDALTGEDSREQTRELFRKKLRDGLLDDKEIELDVADTSNPMQMFEIPGQPNGNQGMMNIGDIFGKAFSGRTSRRKMSVAESYKVLIEEEADKLVDQETVTQEAVSAVEENGIVFLDEIDKVCARSDARGADVSREGVQRDLLPLIEGTTVSTKHGPVKTDHILFIASGAFHIAKPSDLLPELQGRLPIRVELRALTEEDFVRIFDRDRQCADTSICGAYGDGRGVGRVCRRRHRCHRSDRGRSECKCRKHRCASALYHYRTGV